MAHGGGHGGGGALKEFFIALGLDADSASFAAAEAMVHGLEKGLEVAVEVAEELAEKFVETIHETIEWGEELQTASVMLGQTTEALQIADFQARISNVSNEEMRMGYVHLARSMAEARDGNYELQRTYARLGTRITDATGKLRDQGDVLLDVAEGIRKLPTQADRLAAAQQIFGRSGARLLPLLMKGKAGLAELREEAEKLGVVLSGEQVEAAAAAGEELKKLTAVGESVVREFALPIIEALSPLLKALVEWVKTNRELISTKVREWSLRIADGLVLLAGWLVTVAHGVGFVVEHWQAFVVVLGSVTAAMAINTLAVEGAVAAYVQLALAATAGAVRAAVAWLAAIAPIVLLAAGIALVVLGVQDFVGFLEGKDSLVGRIFQGWAREAMNAAQAVRSILPSWLNADPLARSIDTDAQQLGLKKTVLPGQVFSGLQSASNAVPGAQFLLDRFFTGPGGATAPATGRPQAGGPISVHQTINAQPTQSPKEIADESVKRIAEFHDARMREVIGSIP